MTKEERIQKMADYFQVNTKVIMYWLQDIHERTSRQWSYWTFNGQTPENNLDFNSALQYEPSSVCFNYIEVFPSYTDIWEEIKDLKPKNILDFGCGTAVYSVYFAENCGSEITVADFPGLMLNFVKWCMQGKELSIKNPMDRKITDKYDTIICIDVLEHLFDPMEAIEYLTNSLKKGGILILKVSCCYGVSHCDKGIHRWLENSAEYMQKHYERVGNFKYIKK